MTTKQTIPHFKKNDRRTCFTMVSFKSGHNVKNKQTKVCFYEFVYERGCMGVCERENMCHHDRYNMP